MFWRLKYTIYEKILFKMASRLETWQSLASVNQDLMLTLYGSYENYLEPPLISPLEPYIIEFDRFMGGDLGILRQLAFRMGFRIPRNADEDVYFYWMLKRAIDTFGLTKVVGANNPNLGEIINMTESDYKAWLEEQGEAIYKYTTRVDGIYFNNTESTTDTYHNRLMIFIDYYNNGGKN